MSTPWDRCSGDGWTPDPRPVPAELEPDYTPALDLAADIINGLPDEAQDAIWEAVERRTFDCPHCTSEFTSAYAAIICAEQCEDDARQRRRDGRGSD